MTTLDLAFQDDAGRERRAPCTETVIGVGYEGLTLESLVAGLVLDRIDIVIDVRLNALSRKPGFSKRALMTALDAAGITYLHERDLGNPRDNRAAYSRRDEIEGAQARERYRSIMRGPAGEAAIMRVRLLAELNSVALLCFEADGARCHREQILQAVLDQSPSDDTRSEQHG